MTNSNYLKSTGSKIASQAKSISVGIARDVLASTHFISQSIADGCIKAEVKLTDGDYEEVANNRHNTTKMTQQEIISGCEAMLDRLGL